MADPNNIVQLKTRDNGMAGQFPVQLGTADPMDVQMGIRQQLVGKRGEVDGMGIAIADQPVFDYLERKKEDLFLAEFQAYVNAQANLGEPAEAAWWYERFPWLKEKRLQEIDRVSDLQKRLAQINVTGIQNEDDMRLLFGIEQGFIKVPTKPVQDLYEDTARFKQPKDFISGIFSPLSTQPGTQRGKIGLPKQLSRVPAWSRPLDPNASVDVSGSMPTINSTYDKLFPGR